MTGAMPRLAWAIVGVAGAILCVGAGSPWLLVAWLVPDLGVLAGGARLVDDRGQLTRVAALGYNATHALYGPTVLATLAVATSRTWLVAVAGLWWCHIGVDRALGYTLKPVPHRG